MPTTIPRRSRRNWWHEHVMETWRAAYDQWCADAEAASNGWATELAEWRETHPTPTLKATLIGLSR